MRARSAALALAACLAGCALPKYGKPASDPAGALLLLERDLFAALQRKDAAALRLLLAEEFVLRTPGAPDTGREAFIAAVLKLEGQLEVTGEGVDARLVGETGVITGMQHGRVRLKDGTQLDDVQAFTDLAVRRDGRWQLVLAHSAPLQR